MIRVGINGMGRIGRLLLRAAMGAAHRPADDPRAENRLDVVQVNELNGHAVRAPILNASLTDCVVELARPATAAAVNDAFAAAAGGALAGILGIEHRPLVSADHAGDTRSAIVDAASTMVTDDTLLKVHAWYDNEMGYACRMVDLANHIAATGL